MLHSMNPTTAHCTAKLLPIVCARLVALAARAAVAILFVVACAETSGEPTILVAIVGHALINVHAGVETINNFGTVSRIAGAIIPGQCIVALPIGSAAVVVVAVVNITAIGVCGILSVCLARNGERSVTALHAVQREPDATIVGNSILEKSIGVRSWHCVLIRLWSPTIDPRACLHAQEIASATTGNIECGWSAIPLWYWAGLEFFSFHSAQWRHSGHQVSAKIVIPNLLRLLAQHGPLHASLSSHGPADSPLVLHLRTRIRAPALVDPRRRRSQGIPRLTAVRRGLIELQDAR
mmetsp:Transcript_32572/g.78247  ORF Transcript_32572/g.78247 Transcript_32572/m.78247 type:complete len:294 (+) Transcript_32572:5528-6409(+)